MYAVNFSLVRLIFFNLLVKYFADMSANSPMYTTIQTEAPKITDELEPCTVSDTTHTNAIEHLEPIQDGAASPSGMTDNSPPFSSTFVTSKRISIPPAPPSLTALSSTFLDEFMHNAPKPPPTPSIPLVSPRKRSRGQ